MGNEDLNFLPFRSGLKKNSTEGFENDVKLFENDPRFVVKTPKEDMDVVFAPEAISLTTEALLKERYRKAFVLLKEYLADFIPNSEFLIGHSEKDEKPKIYIVQEKVIETEDERKYFLGIIGTFLGDGESLLGRLEEAFKHEIRSGETIENFLTAMGISNREIQIARILDDMAYRSLLMWYKTYKSNEKGPLSISHDRILRYKTFDEGLMPEILNYKNILLGSKNGEQKHGIYCVDNGVIAVPSSFLFSPSPQNGFFGEYLKGLMILYKASSYVDDDFIHTYDKTPEEVSKIRTFCDSKAIKLYEQIKKELESSGG